MNHQTRQKEVKHSKSFKAPNLNERLTTHSSQGAIIHQKDMIRKKPKPIKELKEEYDVTRR